MSLPPPALGATEEFSVLELSTDEDEPPERRTITATVRRISDRAYFFVEDGADASETQLDRAVRAFEGEVWPAVTGAFGGPATPGIDGDPRIAILHADLGQAVSGYVSYEDTFTHEAAPGSNQREIVYLNLSLQPGSPSYARTLAHELQHLIHARHDPDEESWVNEGLSELAARLVGSAGTFHNAFLDQPDTQLDAWTLIGSSAAHYGAASLFIQYLLQRTGGSALDFSADPENSVAGVRAFLAATGGPTFEELLSDWTVATLLDEPTGPYGYRELDTSEPSTVPVERSGAFDGEVRQLAADYLELDAEHFPSGATVSFAGGRTVAPSAAAEGASGAFWFSGRGDNRDARLTRELDLRDVTSATLTFRTWYDIERWYDFGYVAVSTDGGERWTALAGRHTSTEDPIAVAYGPGYGGETGGWVEERIDLTPYAGSKVLLRFEYVTDDSSNAGGWALDDIAVSAIGFLDNAEGDAGGWHREGFRRVQAPIPQTFELRLITFGAAPAVEPVALDAANRAEVSLEGLGTAYQRAVLVVVATVDGTLVPARYTYEVDSS